MYYHIPHRARKWSQSKRIRIRNGLGWWLAGAPQCGACPYHWMPRLDARWCKRHDSRKICPGKHIQYIGMWWSFWQCVCRNCFSCSKQLWTAKPCATQIARHLQYASQKMQFHSLLSFSLKHFLPTRGFGHLGIDTDLFLCQPKLHSRSPPCQLCAGENRLCSTNSNKTVFQTAWQKTIKMEPRWILETVPWNHMSIW